MIYCVGCMLPPNAFRREGNEENKEIYAARAARLLKNSTASSANEKYSPVEGGSDSWRHGISGAHQMNLLSSSLLMSGGGAYI